MKIVSWLYWSLVKDSRRLSTWRLLHLVGMIGGLLTNTFGISIPHFSFQHTFVRYWCISVFQSIIVLINFHFYTNRSSKGMRGMSYLYWRWCSWSLYRYCNVCNLVKIPFSALLNKPVFSCFLGKMHHFKIKWKSSHIFGGFHYCEIEMLNTKNKHFCADWARAIRIRKTT